MPRRRLTAVYFIMSLYLMVFTFLEFAPYYLPSNTMQKYFLADYTSVLIEGQYYRLLISIFAGIGDLSLAGLFSVFIACYVIYTLGAMAEEVYGEFGLLFTYIASGLFGSITGVFLMQNVSMGFALGVLGVIGGLLAYIRLERRDMENSYYIQTIAIGFVLTLFDMVASGISVICYVVSFIIGFLIAIVFIKFRKQY